MTLAEIKRLTAAATAGPWIERVYSCDCCADIVLENGKSIMYVLNNLPAVHSGTDAAFIAMSRSVLPQLLAVAEASQELIAFLDTAPRWDDVQDQIRISAPRIAAALRVLEDV